MGVIISETLKKAGLRDISTYKRVNVGEIPKIPTGLDLDKDLFGGIRYGDLTLISGAAGCSKTTLVSQIVCMSIETNRPVMVVSGENGYPDWLDKIVRNQLGPGFGWIEKSIQGTGYTAIEPDPETELFIRKEINGMVFGYTPQASDNQLQDIINVAHEYIKMCLDQGYSAPLIVLDNLMTLECMTPFIPDTYTKQKLICNTFASLAKDTGFSIGGEPVQIPVVLICKLRKSSSSNGKQPADSLDEISGASEIGKLAGLAINIGYKPDDKKHKSSERIYTITKTRFSTGHEKDEYVVAFDRDSMRTYSVGDYDTLFMHRRWRELINSEDFTVGLISKYEADEMEMRRRITTSPQEYYQKPVL